MTKVCKKCGEEKDASHFYTQASSRDGLERQCKKCKSLLKRDRISKDEQKYASRRWELEYGIGIEQVKQMFVSQNGQCAICLKEFKNKSELRIDHNHETGQVRQILCDMCNKGLGHFKENLDSLQRAIDYIKKWNSTSIPLQ